MHKIPILSLFLVSLFVSVFAQKVLLTDVKVLTLERGKMTTGRRSSPISQLQCSGAACYSEYEPAVVQCENRGSDSYGNVQWRCDAQLDQDVQFGKTIVSCEGYDYPDDPYILSGSCGLEYELEYTRLGKQKKNSGSSYFNTGSSGDYYSYKQNSSFDLGTWIGIILICVIMYAIWNQLQTNQNRERYGGNYRPGGTDDFGPGGHDNRNDYPHNKYPNTGSTYTQPPAYGYGAPGYGYGYGGYRPGFWTGFGGGGLLGYLLGSRRGYGTGYGTGYGGYGTGYRSSGGSFGGGSSGSRTSSGFGGTRRR